MELRAVVFDLGGVVLGSPLEAIARYERELALPAGFVSRVVVEGGPAGAWSRLERGELDLARFHADFETECGAAGGRLSAPELMARIHASAAPRPAMLEAVRRIRAHGLRAAALTNNWIGEGNADGGLREHFDLVIESSVEGLRKPDPRIYQLLCERLAIQPPQAVFLDDIGGNLKPARALGMHTLKVYEPYAALVELEALLGFPLA